MPDGLGETAIREPSLAVKFPILALAQHGRRPFVMIVTVALSLAALVLAATVMAQSQDPLELYDANDNGSIDADELITAVTDYFAGRIDRAMALRVLNLYLASDAGRSSARSLELCRKYDATMYGGNNNNLTDRDEVIAAIRDYFNDVISRNDVIQVIRCYFGNTNLAPAIPVPPLIRCSSLSGKVTPTKDIAR